jgi:hypothetical protein
MIYNIAEIAFEQIHNEYHWAKYGEFKVIMNINTCYINATHLCGLATTKTGARKEYKHWKSNITTDELIKEVSASVGIPTDGLDNVITGGSVTEIRGTYVHPDLIPHIACWASPKFAVKVSKIVNEQIVRDYREAIRAKDTRIDEMSRQIQELLNEARAAREDREQLNNQIEHLVGGVEELSIDNNKLAEDVGALTKTNEAIAQTTNLIAHKLDIATEDRVPRHPIDACNEIFAIYHRPGTTQYRMIKRQKKSVRDGIKECTSLGFTVCVYQSDSPNAVNLGGRFREALPKTIGRVVWNNITLVPGLTTEHLVNFVRLKEAEKKNV